MTVTESQSMTYKEGRSRPCASLNAENGDLLGSGAFIALGGRTEPRAEVFEDAGRWRLLLVGCHRDLDITFRNLSDAVRVGEDLVGIAIEMLAIAYDRDPFLVEASA